jgi:hypothetical protein
VTAGSGASYNRTAACDRRRGHDAVDAMRTKEDWADLRHEIQKGLDQLDRGEGISAEQVFAELRERNKRLKEKRKK